MPRITSVAPAALLWVALAVGAQAVTYRGYTPTAEQVAACTPDVLRLCAAEILSGVERIVACMRANQSQISAGCRATLRGGKM